MDHSENGACKSSSVAGQGLKGLAAEPYEGFNEDLLALAVVSGPIRHGAGEKLRVIAGYANRGNVSHFVKETKDRCKGTNVSQLAKKQRLDRPSLAKLRGKNPLDVADALGLANDANATNAMFAASNQAELLLAFSQFYGEWPLEIPLVQWASETSVNAGPSVDAEAYEEFFREHIENRSYPLLMQSPAHNGASHALHLTNSLLGAPWRAIHVTPPLSGIHEPDVLEQLLHAFGTSRALAQGGKLQLPYLVMETAQKQNISIIIHNAHLIQGQGHKSLLALLDRAAELASTMRGVSPADHGVDRDLPAAPVYPNLILHYPSGHEPNISKLRHRLRRYGIPVFSPSGVGETDEGVETRLADAKAIAETELLRMIEYVGSRSQAQIQPVFARMAQGPARVRIRRQIERMMQAGIFPRRTSMLIRAAALTDPRVIAPDDPTIGLTNLVGFDAAKKFPEFERLRHDILSSIRGMGERHLRALRLISTSIHWITKSMVKDINKNTRNGAHSIFCEWSDIIDLIEDSEYALASCHIPEGSMASS